ncbi:MULTISPECIES: helix-turn-helix domain-containing protein [Bacteroidales]|jgi:transcriptional regulator with XRE-family HTH domain|uniref:helix-turn-helix domain-containing protein n=1 Tax=Bacteroidales TaxID=171549 RepID=UPI00267576CE|nr:helix-turn-helix domain-containing protein [Paraprevotella clara]CAJ1767124.1 transcriptional repressor [uncultured phage]CAJ1891186.1 transcriptional repressor [uncultured phage]
MNKKERLEAIIKHYSDGKPSVFAKLIGVAPSTISSWLSRDTLDYDLLFAKCENISSEWLLTGRGEMINIQTSTFNNQTTLPQKEGTGIEDKLLAIIADKDATIREMAEEIGMLKQTITQLKQDKSGRVSDASDSTVANAV